MSEWISVNERLPNKPSNRFSELRHLVTDGIKVVEASFVFWPPWIWILPDGMKSVTHWMPLPEPPKPEEKSECPEGENSKD